MAAPAIIPMLKKAATAVVSNKKLRKVVIGIVLGVLFLILLPIIAVLGIFSGTIDVGIDNVKDILEQKQQIAEYTMSDIEQEMLADGYFAQRIEEAQALYMVVFFGYSEDEGFVEKYVGCFEIEQTDEELISTVNSKFGTVVTTQEFVNVVQEIRDKYAELEKQEEFTAE